MIYKMAKNTNRRQWRKILYEPQLFPDNYVDVSFLEELKKNLHVHSYDIKTLVLEASNLSQQISSIALFVTMFFYMEDQSVSPQRFWCIASLITTVGYFANSALCYRRGESLSFKLFLQHCRTCAIFQFLGAALSPILVSLTETISTDTIYAMTTLMLLANFLFYNYNYFDDGQVPGPLSLNAAVFASVCLASRLHTAWHAFTTVTVSFQLFALGPLLRKNLKTKPKPYEQKADQKKSNLVAKLSWPEIHLVASLKFALVCCLCLATKSIVGSVLFILAQIFIMAICPLWLFSLQKHKNNIYGPWDEAVIKDT